MDEIKIDEKMNEWLIYFDTNLKDYKVKHVEEVKSLEEDDEDEEGAEN